MQTRTTLRAASAVVAAMVVAMVASLVIATPAHATTRTLAANTYTNVTSTSTYLKITVPSEGYVTLYGRMSSGGAGYAEAQLLNSKKAYVSYDGESYDIDFTSITAATKAITKKVAVSKGTYYIKLTDVYLVTPTTKAQVKYTFTAVTQPTNYCMGNAQTLKYNTYKTLYNTPAKTFARFYKITNGKARKIHVDKVGGSTGIYIYDANGDEVDTTTSYSTNTTTGVTTTTYTTTNKQAAGTFYIVVDPARYQNAMKSSIVKLKWY